MPQKINALSISYKLPHLNNHTW